MDPFFSGIAIGIAIGLPIFLGCILLGLLILLFTIFVKSPAAFCAGWREGRARQACIGAVGKARRLHEREMVWAEARARAERIRAAGEARRQHDLAWMERSLGDPMVRTPQPAHPRLAVAF